MLSAAECDAMRRHPIVGAEPLEPLSLVVAARCAARPRRRRDWAYVGVC